MLRPLLHALPRKADPQGKFPLGLIPADFIDTETGNSVLSRICSAMPWNRQDPEARGGAVGVVGRTPASGPEARFKPSAARVSQPASHRWKEDDTSAPHQVAVATTEEGAGPRSRRPAAPAARSLTAERHDTVFSHYYAPAPSLPPSRPGLPPRAGPCAALGAPPALAGGRGTHSALRTRAAPPGSRTCAHAPERGASSAPGPRRRRPAAGSPAGGGS